MWTKKDEIKYLEQLADNRLDIIDALTKDAKGMKNEIDKLRDQVVTKDAEIEKLRERNEDFNKTIDRLNKRLAEHENFERKIAIEKKQAKLELGAHLDPLTERLCRIEARLDAQDGMYIF